MTEEQTGTNGTNNSTPSNSRTTNEAPSPTHPEIPGRILPGQIRMESLDQELLIKKGKLEE